MDEENLYRSLCFRLSIISLAITLLIVILGILRWVGILSGVLGLEFMGLGTNPRSITFGELFDIIFINTRFKFGTILIFALLIGLAVVSMYNTVNGRYTSYHYLKGRSRPTGWIGLLIFFSILFITGIIGLGFQLLNDSSYNLLVILLCCSLTVVVSTANYSNSSKHPIYSLITTFSTTLALISIFNFINEQILYRPGEQTLITLLAVILSYITLHAIFLQIEGKPLIRNY
jgi:hypothetical protein